MPADKTLEPFVAKLARQTPLDDQAREALLALPYKARSLEARQYIVREGDFPKYSCILLSGFAVRHKIVGDGGRQILSIHLQGDAVDLQNSLLKFADHSVQTLTAADVAFVPREAVVEIAAANPQIGMALWIDTLVDGSIFREWIANIGRRDARARIAHVLCEFALRLEAAGLGESSHYELPMTQEQLADVLGLTPIHVNRTLKALEEENLITRDKRAVRIADWSKLIAVADFTSNYLHLDGLGSEFAPRQKA